jgi:hypothetical protein
VKGGEGGEGCSRRGRERGCLQDPGRPENAPKDQVMVYPGRSLVHRRRGGARARSRTDARRQGVQGRRAESPHGSDNPESAALGDTANKTPLFLVRNSSIRVVSTRLHREIGDKAASRKQS